MTPGVVAAHEGAVFKEIVAAMARNKLSTLPVIDDDRHVVGVVSESDLLARVTRELHRAPRIHRFHPGSDTRHKMRGATAHELMTSPAIIVLPDTPMEDATLLAARRRVRWLAVVDRDHVLLGVVTRADLLKPFLRPDEDIAHEITERLMHYHPDASVPHVSVEVDEGVVTLRGEIDLRTRAARLVRAVHAVAGVVDVVDHLHAPHDDTQLPPPRVPL